MLTLLSEVAEEQPLICMVDDAQWLDQASAQTLEFVARRLAAEPVGLVFAVRETDEEPKLAGLPELRLRGLGIDDAAALLESAVPGTLDPRVRDRILAESDGNPLALLELPRALTPAELAFGTASRARSTAPLANRLEQGFIRQLSALPQPSRQLLLAAAAEPVGDVPLLWRAAQRLGIGADAAADSRGGGPDRATRPGPVPASPGSFGRLPLGYPARNGGRSTRRWPTPRTRTSIQTVAPGTAPARRRARTKISRQNSNVRLTARSPSAGWRQQPPSSKRQRR